MVGILLALSKNSIVMIKILRDYQVENALKGVEILNQLKIVYLAFEVRTGKTATSLEIARLFGAKNVLFLTKKKAIDSVKNDYKDFGFKFNIDIVNDESMHTVSSNYDLVVHDEHHRFGAFPKPGKAIKMFKDKYSKLPMVFLSGTPHPESYSQIFHQFWCSQYSPFKNFTNFYKWFAGMGFVKTEFEMQFGTIANYSNNETTINKFYDFKHRYISKDDPDKENKKDNIEKQREFDLLAMRNANNEMLKDINPYMLKYTQKEAGFEAKVNEHILYCNVKPSTLDMANNLKQKRVLQGKSETILADTPVKLMTKLHQLYSGTIKFESGNTMIVDDSKGVFIKKKFDGFKIGIFYKFKEELELLKKVYGDNLCTDLDTFNSTDKNIALQIVSGREGISLKEADYLVYFNIDFSSLSYWQSRDRLTTMDRKSNDIYWIFTKGGIEKNIYNAVVKKKNYTTSVFLKDVKISK